MSSGWDERHAYLEEVARPVTGLMLERIGLQPGHTILDLAAGTGIVGFAAARAAPDTRVIISDFSPAMVETASRRGAELELTNCEYRVLDAEQIDLPDDSVDGVLCRWGYMLMADPAAALAETRRILRPGGRLAAAVFAGPERNPWAGLPGRILIERGHVPPPGPGAPGILALADTHRLRALFGEAGFPEPQIEEVDFRFTYAGEDDYWDFLIRVAGAISMVLGKLDEQTRDAVRAELGSHLAPFSGPEGLSFPGTSLVVSAS